MKKPCRRHFTDSCLAGVTPRPVECKPRGCHHHLIYQKYELCPLGGDDERNRKEKK